MSDELEGDDPDVGLYKHGVGELQDTLQNILASHTQLNQRAIDLVKIDLLSASVVLTGVSLSKIHASLLLLAGFFSFGYSIWSCAKVYHPREFKRGLSENAARKIDQDIRDGMSPKTYYRRVYFSYLDPIEEGREAVEREKNDFQNGLWASITAIMFFAGVGFEQVGFRLPILVEVALLVVIPTVAFWGKDNVSGGENLDDVK
ncbi:hypothetical protein [Halocalculus aciditolerans]|uniref:Uncharacterized protein n=1 Tax=Halocalculus aciditolerans TaxID=1383812 RepID=A0A830F5V4_9EURY|nr:hypothetical protein [Halocalculus aciditolerans]GGL57546.1 hypothetical protein GCM10009039_14620 [Halocalculus aciditolerans]